MVDRKQKAPQEGARSHQRRLQEAVNKNPQLISWFLWFSNASEKRI
jgi:hypothetical protein